MPGSSTTPGRTGTRDDAPFVLPSVKTTTSAPELIQAFAAQWLACVLPCRRFACTLAGADARLGADADRYSFIAADFHHLLLAGLTGAPFFLSFAVRPEGAFHQWREVPPRELSIALVADERFGRATGWIEAS
jgi:hypothetical protein